MEVRQFNQWSNSRRAFCTTEDLHMFDKVTRRGRVLGKRIVAGRVIKESYGAAKQQHTFTPWNNEAERMRVLAQKHKRGAAASFERGMKKRKKSTAVKGGTIRGDAIEKEQHVWIMIVWQKLERWASSLMKEVSNMVPFAFMGTLVRRVVPITFSEWVGLLLKFMFLA